MQGFSLLGSGVETLSLPLLDLLQDIHVPGVVEDAISTLHTHLRRKLREPFFIIFIALVKHCWVLKMNASVYRACSSVMMFPRPTPWLNECAPSHTKKTTRLLLLFFRQSAYLSTLWRGSSLAVIWKQARESLDACLHCILRDGETIQALLEDWKEHDAVQGVISAINTTWILQYHKTSS